MQNGTRGVVCAGPGAGIDSPFGARALRLGATRRRLGLRAGLIVGASALIALCAQVSVPMFPVPITLQTFAVLLVAMALGMRAGVAAVGLYLLEGAMGLPVFAGGTFGAARLIGPTGGYLIGFVVAAAVAGWLSDRGWSRTYATALAAMLVGDAIILGMGGAWLGAWFGGADSFGAFVGGVVPFVPGALVKSAAAAALLPMAWRLSRRG